MAFEQPGYSIAIDAPSKLMRVVMRGFWDALTLDAYDHDIRAAGDAMAAAGCPRSEILAMVDVRELSAQAQHLLAEYKGRFADPKRQPRRLATIVASARVTRQVARIDLPNQRLFGDEAEALAWLKR